MKRARKSPTKYRNIGADVRRQQQAASAAALLQGAVESRRVRMYEQRQMISRLGVRLLRAAAVESGIKGGARMTKDELVTALLMKGYTIAQEVGREEEAQADAVA